MPLCTVVGMGPGLSLCIAERFAKEGYSLAMVARDERRLSSLRGSLCASGYSAEGFVADAADGKSLRSALRRVNERMGPTDALIYNAAAIVTGRPTSLDPETFTGDLRTDVVGALIAAQEVIPAMKQAGRGTILFTGGALGVEPSPYYASLSVGKAALRSLCFCLAGELEPSSIHVAIVTIWGLIQPGTHFAPDKIAEVYLQLARQPAGSWEREVIYR